MENLNERLARMEEELRSLSARVAHLSKDELAPLKPIAEVSLPEPTTMLKPATKAEPLLAKSPPMRAAVERETLKRPAGEFWLRRSGIALVLFGLALLFKYSIERGWLSEELRVMMGLALGTLLTGIGMHIRSRRRTYGQTLLGGGIAAYYMTGFAAYQLYALVPHALAFVFMCGVTLLALVLSVRQREVHLSLIGTIGGLATPFLLYTGSGNLPGLMVYLCILLCATSLVYLLRGWRSLIWVSFLGAWAVLALGLFDLGPIAVERWYLQLGVAFASIAFWAVPLVRESSRLRKSRPAARHVHWLALSTPLLGFLFYQGIWEPSAAAWGWCAAATALVCGLTAKGLWQERGCRALAQGQAIVFVLLQALALGLLLDGSLLLLSLAGEVVALHWCARRWNEHYAQRCAHVLFATTASFLGYRLLGDAQGTALLNAQALCDLVVVAVMAGLVIWLRNSEQRVTYGVATHVAVLAWLLRELSGLEGGHGYVTAAWGLYAIALLVIGLRRNLSEFRIVALGTLLLVVGKLFVFDLSQVETLWRIMLFLGFGGGFLVLGYYFQSLWLPSSAK